MFARVLVPLDGSRLSEQALDSAAAIAERFGARVTLLLGFEGLDHLAQVFARDGGELDRAKWEAMHRSTENALAAARQYLDARAAPFAERGIAVDTTIVDVRRGSAAGAIVEEAGRAPDTLLVMSTHGRSGLRRMIFGSTAQKVLETSPAPVLLIRAQERG
jgi:nucleotide-binding universal stress UspA family protein